MVLGREVHGIEDGATRGGTLGIEDLKPVQLRLLGHAVGVRPYDSRHVGAVPGAVPILAVPDEVLQERRPPAEVVMRRLDARVDYVHARALAGRLVVHVVAAARLPVRDPCNAPGRIGLSCQGSQLNRLVLLDVRNL